MQRQLRTLLAVLAFGTPCPVPAADLGGFVNHGLVGVGRLPAHLFDKAGDGRQDTIGGFSAMAIDPASLQHRTDGEIAGTLIGLPDRGFGDGTTDYRPRLEIFDFVLRPYYGTGPVGQDQIVLTNVATRILTYDGGTPFTGFDGGSTNSPTVPQSPSSSLGGGRRSIDAEGLVVMPDSSYWVSDEYGPGIFRFDASANLIQTLLTPDALLPKAGAYPGRLNFGGVSAPTSGRRNNRGMEGLTLTPDGQRLVGMLQSPTIQDGGGGNLGRNTRVLQYDAVPASPTFGLLVAEHVYPLTLNGTTQTNRHTPVSEVLALDSTTFLALERDSNGLGIGTNLAPVYKRLVLFSTEGATNIAGTGYDLEKGAPGQISLPSSDLGPTLAPVQRFDFVDLLDPAQLAKFGLNANATHDSNTLSEKWEGLALVPLNDPSAPDDFLVLVGNDNDFKAPITYHNGVPVGTNDVSVDLMVLAYRVTLPNFGKLRPANNPPSVQWVLPDDSRFAAGPLPLTVAVYDSDGRVLKAEYFEDGTKLGEVTALPWTLTVPNPLPGIHTYRVLVTDNAGATAEISKTVEITASNAAPAVTLVSPTPNGTAAAPHTLSLRVDVSDADGYITNVTYFSGTTRLGGSPSSPFSIDVPNAAVRVHSLTAVATDNLGLSSTSAPVAFTVTRAVTAPLVVQVLHASDFEAGTDAIADAPRFSSVLNGLRSVYPDTSIVLAGGDNYIPSPFFTAAADPEAGFGGEKGRGDIALVNALGVQASGIGNHEFDDGTARFATLLRAVNTTNLAYTGTLFPYVSANLNFAADSATAGLVGADGSEARSLTNRTAHYAVLRVSGQLIGITGVTTPEFKNITSSGSIGLDTNLVASTQAAIDALLALGCNKILVLAHLQQIANEIELAGQLRDADVVLAAGSGALLAKPTDRLRAGDVRDGDYPLASTSASAEPVLVVNTDGNFRYVGRLVVRFDELGRIETIDPVSGAYATDPQGVLEAGNAPPSAGVMSVVDRLGTIINAKDSKRFGRTTVYLNGLRNSVRSEETNLGDLSAEANLARARKTDPTASLSIKNGGGIRDAIGTIDDRGNRLPPAGNASAGKSPGEVSQLDIENALRFNNTLSLITLTAQQLRDAMEWGVAATTASSTPGQFPQVDGIWFSYDIGQPAMVYVRDAQNNPVSIQTPGSRLRNLVARRADGTLDLVVENGQLVGDPTRKFRTVTLNFLAGGGDSYLALRESTERVDLVSATTQLTFDTDGGEQRALAEYLASIGVYSGTDGSRADDRRIQNLGFRPDSVLSPEWVNAVRAAGGLMFGLQTLPGKSYTIWYRDHVLQPWSSAGITISGDGSVRPIQDTGASTSVPIRFYGASRDN